MSLGFEPVTPWFPVLYIITNWLTLVKGQNQDDKNKDGSLQLFSKWRTQRRNSILVVHWHNLLFHVMLHVIWTWTLCLMYLPKLKAFADKISILTEPDVFVKHPSFEKHDPDIWPWPLQMTLPFGTRCVSMRYAFITNMSLVTKLV